MRQSSLEQSIARLLTVGTFASMALIALGVVLMAATGHSPLDPASELDLGRIPADVAALRPSGFLWLGLIGLVATPSARVVAALVGYLQGGERGMAAVGLLILLVVAAGVVLGTTAG